MFRRAYTLRVPGYTRATYPNIIEIIRSCVWVPYPDTRVYPGICRISSKRPGLVPGQGRVYIYSTKHALETFLHTNNRDLNSSCNSISNVLLQPASPSRHSTIILIVVLVGAPSTSARHDTHNEKKKKIPKLMPQYKQHDPHKNNSSRSVYHIALFFNTPPLLFSPPPNPLTLAGYDNCAALFLVCHLMIIMMSSK